MFKKFIDSIKRFSKFIYRLLVAWWKRRWWTIGFIIVFLAVFGITFFTYYWLWESEQSFLAYSEEAQEALDLYFQFTRKLGWFIWAGFSLLALVVTLFLTIWGRKIQEKQWETENEIHKLQLKSHLHERYENSCSMLGNGLIAVRIAGCQALGDLYKENNLDIELENLKDRCVRLLLAFINNPYLEDKYDKEFYESEDVKLINLFPSHNFLRDDIQEAFDNFSIIYNKYVSASINEQKVILPQYFLQNRKRKPITLIKANLENVELQKAFLEKASLPKANLRDAKMQGAKLWNADLQKANLRDAKMQGAELWEANLQEANLEHARMQGADLFSARMQGAILKDARMQGASLWDTELQKADLSDAILGDADISGANMRESIGLTKKQVLSAIWGYNESGHGGPPELPEELADDPEVKKWLAEPNYDLREKEE